MSNINSCSLPQTPKDDPKKGKEQEEKNEIQKQEALQKVFEYRPAKQNDTQILVDDVEEVKSEVRGE